MRMHFSCMDLNDDVAWWQYSRQGSFATTEVALRSAGAAYVRSSLPMFRRLQSAESIIMHFRHHQFCKTDDSGKFCFA